MDINLSLSPAPGITTNYLVFAVYDQSAPGTPAAVQPFAAPHVAPRNIIFEELSTNVYEVRCYESPTTDPSGVLRHKFMYDPSYQKAEIRADLWLVAGETADFNPGDTSYTDESFIGWNYTIERRGIGSLRPVAEAAYNEDGTGFALAEDNAVGEGDVFVIHFQPKITTVTPIGNQSAGSVFSSVIAVTDDITLDATAMGRLFLLRGDNATLVITMPSFATIPDGRFIGFKSEGGVHINATLKMQGSDMISQNNILRPEIYMAQCESLWFFKFDGIGYTMNEFGNFNTVGRVVADYQVGGRASTFADGLTRSRLQYPRLWNQIKDLGANIVVSDANWLNTNLNNQGKYSLGNGTTTFRVPKLFNPGFLRGVDGSTRSAGSFEAQDVQELTGSIPLAPNDFVGGIEMYGRGGTPLSNVPVKINEGHLETRSNNIGIYLSILI